MKRKLRADLRKALSSELEDIFGERSYLRSKRLKQRVKDIEKTKGKSPTLAPFINKRFHIRLRYKGKLYIAHVRKNGSISFAAESAEAKKLEGKVYNSPSLATKAIAGRAMNGWTAWTYERAPGDWVVLDELRK